MKIAILGAGAMGILYGGYLAQNNDVTLIGHSANKMAAIARNGVRIQELDGSEVAAHPRACLGGELVEPMDLVIVFVKATHTRQALEANRSLLCSDTWVMTLQNGSGHEEVLRDFASDDRIIIGTTMHNSSMRGEGAVRHGGSGITTIGALNGPQETLLPIAECFTVCGLECQTTAEIQKVIWRKLFTNATSSVLTGVLQTAQGFLLDSPSAWAVVETLIREAVCVANGDGMDLDENLIVNQIHDNLERARKGITSICADLRDGRKTEVDTISGSVVRASRRNGTPAPTHELMLLLVHALEDRAALDAGVSR